MNGHNSAAAAAAAAASQQAAMMRNIYQQASVSGGNGNGNCASNQLGRSHQYGNGQGQLQSPHQLYSSSSNSTTGGSASSNNNSSSSAFAAAAAAAATIRGYPSMYAAAATSHQSMSPFACMPHPNGNGGGNLGMSSTTSGRQQSETDTDADWYNKGFSALRMNTMGGGGQHHLGVSSSPSPSMLQYQT